MGGKCKKDRTEYYHQWYLANKERLRPMRNAYWHNNKVKLKARRKPIDPLVKKIRSVLGVSHEEARRIIAEKNLTMAKPCHADRNARAIEAYRNGKSISTIMRDCDMAHPSYLYYALDAAGVPRRIERRRQNKTTAVSLSEGRGGGHV